MMSSEDIISIMKKARKEMDDNRDVVCAMTEICIVFMPIIPSSLWNRALILCLYILLYTVNAQDKYYEMKNKYLMAPRYEYDTLSDDESHVDMRNDLSLKASASEAEAEGSADEGEAQASADEAEAEASADETDEAEASEAEDDDSDSDYEDDETKKNK